MKTGLALKIPETEGIKYAGSKLKLAMRWTNDWIRESEKPNQEYLFLIEK
ncbi:MAG: hypothetical protein ACR2MG_14110 [Pyrinomonadaceae bacterium]